MAAAFGVPVTGPTWSVVPSSCQTEADSLHQDDLSDEDFAADLVAMAFSDENSPHSDDLSDEDLAADLVAMASSDEDPPHPDDFSDEDFVADFVAMAFSDEGPPHPDDLLDEDFAADLVAMAFSDEDVVGKGVSRQVDSEICAKLKTVAVAAPISVPIFAHEQSMVPVSNQIEAYSHDRDFFSRAEPVPVGGLEKGGSEICIILETVAAPISSVSESAPEESMAPVPLERDFVFNGDLVAHLAEFELLSEDTVHGDSETNIELKAREAQITASKSPLPIPNQEMQRGAPTFLVELPENRALVPLGDKTIYHALDVIAGTMFGSSRYITMKRSGDDFVKELQGRLPQCLQELQEKGKKGIKEALSLLDPLLSKRKQTEKEPEEVGETAVLLEEWREIQEKIDEALDKIYFPISLKLKKTADDFLPGLLADFPESLKDIKEKNDFVVTLEEVKNEASKLIYFQMGEVKPVAHPEHIQNIPRVWRREHPGCEKPCIQKRPSCKVCKRTCYPPLPAYQSIANYTGLKLKQVQDLFQNDRKRRAPKDPALGDGQLLKHFDEDVTDMLRNWKARNPGRKLPDQATLKDLMGATGMDKTQIINWFGNNAPGRENRNHPRKRRRMS